MENQWGDPDNGTSFLFWESFQAAAERTENAARDWCTSEVGETDKTCLESLWVVIRELIQVHMRRNYLNPRKEHRKILKGIGPGEGLSSQGYNLSSSHVRMLDHKEGWALQNWGFGTVVLQKTWKSLGLQGDPTSLSKRKLTLIFIGRTDAEAEVTILWLPDVKSWISGKDPDAVKDWGQEEKG